MRNDLPGLGAAQVIALAAFARAAMMVLTARILTLLSMLLSAGGFAWVLVDPHVIRLAAACAFALLVFWPCQRLEREHREAVPAEQPAKEE